MFRPGMETGEKWKQGEDGNAGRAKLQFHSTSVVIGIVSQYKLRVPIERRGDNSKLLVDIHWTKIFSPDDNEWCTNNAPLVIILSCTSC